MSNLFARREKMQVISLTVKRCSNSKRFGCFRLGLKKRALEASHAVDRTIALSCTSINGVASLPRRAKVVAKLSARRMSFK